MVSRPACGRMRSDEVCTLGSELKATTRTLRTCGLARKVPGRRFQLRARRGHTHRTQLISTLTDINLPRLRADKANVSARLAAGEAFLVPQLNQAESHAFQPTEHRT